MMISEQSEMFGMSEQRIKNILRKSHYTHSVPSSKGLYYYYRDAVVAFNVPANKNISTFLTGRPNVVWELSRLWAPDGHDKNLLTAAISDTIGRFRKQMPEIEALVSYADPNANHLGGVYRAASWIYLGQCEESRCYRSKCGQILARRKFHSGQRSLTKSEIEARGYVEILLPGKHRFARGLTKRARKMIRRRT